MALARIEVEGIPDANGSYTLDDTLTFTGRELRLIKQLSGCRLSEIEEALNAGDYDLIIAMTIIAAKRAGKTIPADALLDAEAGTIRVIALEDESEDPTTSLPQNENGSSGSGRSSSDASPSTSESSETTPSRTGDPGSGITSG